MKDRSDDPSHYERSNVQRHETKLEDQDSVHLRCFPLSNKHTGYSQFQGGCYNLLGGWLHGQLDSFLSRNVAGKFLHIDGFCRKYLAAALGLL